MPIKFSFILVSTVHSGNVGSAARAMINMGFKDLRLVAPRCSPADADARKMAMAGKPLLRRMKVYDTVSDAIADSNLVIGTACLRSFRKLKRISTREIPELIKKEKGVKRVALLFGPEEVGLSNEDLSLCDYIATIPTDTKNPSINLSQAVLILGYELSQLKKHKIKSLKETMAKKSSLTNMMKHLEKVLWEVDYMDKQNPFRNRLVLRSLFRRAKPTESEIFHLRAMYRKILNRIR